MAASSPPYVVREVPTTDYLGDADAVMREFTRAEALLNKVSFHHVKDSTGITYSDVVKPSQNQRGLKITHDEGGTPLKKSMKGTWTLPASQDPEVWLDLKTPAGGDFIQTFTTYTDTPFVFWFCGTFAGTGTPPVLFDFRLLIDGEPGSVLYSENSGMTAATTYRSVSIEEVQLLGPGEHRVSVQLRVRTAAGATGGESVTNGILLTLGLTR